MILPTPRFFDGKFELFIATTFTLNSFSIKDFARVLVIKCNKTLILK